jgi:alanine racemase
MKMIPFNSLYSIQTVCDIIKGKFLKNETNIFIENLVYDSRYIAFPQTSLFFALKTRHQDGHQFINDAYNKGIRNFVIQGECEDDLPGANFILVENTLNALHQLAIFHRSQFDLPVVGITGSNGKTIVKEWLYQLLQDEYNIVRSPKSHNSQLGVPLSVWEINTRHTLGIFEAGISQPGEMERLQKIIQPHIGIITNLGAAHSEGFTSQKQKLEEKLRLFERADIVIGPHELLKDHNFPKFTWGYSKDCTLRIVSVKNVLKQTNIKLAHKEQNIEISIPFIDEASIENAITCLCAVLYLEINNPGIPDRFATLHAVDMRLQLKRGLNGNTIINDSYSADLTSLNTALHFLKQQQTTQKHTVILSDFVESGKKDDELYSSIARSLMQNNVQKLIAIGEKISKHLASALPPGIELSSFLSTEEFINQFKYSLFNNECILIKGARHYGFERIVRLLEEKVHRTVLEINLNALTHNLKQYRQLLQPGTKVMAMVKAFSYGSGSAEIAGVLQFNNIAYLGVAYVDEGIELRKAGNNLPVMVMNADASSFSLITEFNLQPVLYSFSILHQFEAFLKEQGMHNYPVHIEVESGMNRLGFNIGEIKLLCEHLKQNHYSKVESLFTHLAASEDPLQDDFTNAQVAMFNQAASMISQVINYPFLKHVANSAAILRHNHLQFDMVRLGIGLYGVEIATDQLHLQPVATLRSTIAQIKQLKAGDTVSYNRQGVIREDRLIATVRIGYADGYSRHLGNGSGKMWVGGHLAPVIGTICMDMTMIDITDIPGVKESDDVIIFGKELPVELLATWADTIPYEIMTSVSQRVKRVYFQE